MMHKQSAIFAFKLAAACTLALLTLCSGVFADDDFASPDVAVEQGGEALAQSPDFSWYDEQTDSFRPAKVTPPKPPRAARGGGGGTSGNLLVFAMWMLLAALLVLLIYLIARAFINQEVSVADTYVNSAVGGDISRVEELPVTLATAPEDYLSEAQRLYSKGDFAQAIVYLFSHQLLSLDRRHWVRLIKGKTNRQYLREVRRSAASAATDLATLFEQTVLLFEEVFFGKRLPSSANIDQTWRQIEQFETLLEASADAPANGERAA